jgi:hypothetical protein
MLLGGVRAERFDGFVEECLAREEFREAVDNSTVRPARKISNPFV